MHTSTRGIRVVSLSLRGAWFLLARAIHFDEKTLAADYSWNLLNSLIFDRWYLSGKESGQ
jgi:hypothetical protein